MHRQQRPKTPPTPPHIWTFGKRLVTKANFSCRTWRRVRSRVGGRKIGVPCSLPSQFTPTDQS